MAEYSADKGASQDVGGASIAEGREKMAAIMGRIREGHADKPIAVTDGMASVFGAVTSREVVAALRDSAQRINYLPIGKRDQATYLRARQPAMYRESFHGF